MGVAPCVQFRENLGSGLEEDPDEGRQVANRANVSSVLWEMSESSSPLPSQNSGASQNSGVGLLSRMPSIALGM